MSKLSHIDKAGAAHMVDVSDKDVTARTATARGTLRAAPATIALIAAGEAPKGDVLATARIAGIMAAKNTAALIPLCHPLPVGSVKIEFEVGEDRVDIAATVKVSGKTGVEMEALTAVSVAALTLYDMLKAADKAMEITDIHLALKSGGRSGDYRAADER